MYRSICGNVRAEAKILRRIVERYFHALAVSKRFNPGGDFTYPPAGALGWRNQQRHLKRSIFLKSGGNVVRNVYDGLAHIWTRNRSRAGL